MGRNAVLDGRHNRTACTEPPQPTNHNTTHTTHLIVLYSPTGYAEMNTSNPSNTSSSSSRRQLGRRAHERVKFSWLWVGATILICSFWSFRRTIYSLSTMLSVAYEGGDFLQTIQRSQYNLPPVNVAFGLSGNHPGFLAEFEVALKSVLLNAPMERNLYIHVLADKDAFSSLDEIFNRTLLPTWVTRNPIEIHAYDISSHLPWLRQTIHTHW